MLHLSWTQPPNDYPTSDGKPMAETDPHRRQMMDLIATLEYRYRDRLDVYVSGDILWFYEEGSRHRHLSPDVLVRIGSRQAERLNYLQWEEGGPPQVVFEITSKSTRREDTNHKLLLYQQLGVDEYYLFDPLQEYLKPRFRVYHRRAEQLVPVVGEPVYSPVLDLELLVIQDQLRLREVGSECVLPTPEERAELAEERANHAGERADQAEARLAAERAEMAALRAELERLRTRD